MNIIDNAIDILYQEKVKIQNKVISFSKGTYPSDDDFNEIHNYLLMWKGINLKIEALENIRYKQVSGFVKISEEEYNSLKKDYKDLSSISFSQ